jgi:hypothetical protein
MLEDFTFYSVIHSWLRVGAGNKGSSGINLEAGPFFSFVLRHDH